jgi:hypothetical protein
MVEENKRSKLGFEIIEVVRKANTVQELDDAITVLNHAYPVIRQQLETIESLGGY